MEEHSTQLLNAQKELERRRKAAGVEIRPFSDAVRVDWSSLAEQARQRLYEATAGAKQNREGGQKADQGAINQPGLGLAALKAGKAAVYRIWLLARHFDGDGRGWVFLDEFKDAITAVGSQLRTFKSRQRAGQLLSEGEGELWAFDSDQNGRQRLRYTGAADLAVGWDVYRLTGRPVLLDLATLTGKIGRFKAALYASFHAGRGDENGEGSPISREVQAELTGHSSRTLQRYDRRARVRRKSNFVNAGSYTADKAQNEAWEHGGAAFELTDHQGKQGQPGRQYLARQIPNSYVAEMPTGGRGSQRKINQKLKQPCDYGARGDAPVRKIFHKTATAAAKAFNRQSDCPHYWPLRARSGSRFWGVLML